MARAVKTEVPEISLASVQDSDVKVSYGVITTGKYSAGSAVKEVFNIATGGDKGFMSNFAFELSKHKHYERELDGLASKVAY